MPSLRSSKNKQQTRLTFTPLGPSSPAAPDLSQQTENRVANVRYDWMGSPTKKRRLAPPFPGTSKNNLRMNVSATGDPPIGGALPTPEPSSQIEVGLENDQDSFQHLSVSSSSEEEGPIVRRQHGRNKARSRGNNHGIPSSPTNHPFEGKRSNHDSSSPSNRRSAQPALEDSSDDESDVPSKRTPTSGRRQQHTRNRESSPLTPVTVSSDDDSDATVLRSTRRRRNAGAADPQTPHDKTPTRSSKRLIASKQRHTSLNKRSKEPLQENRLPSEPGSDESSDSGDSLMNELKASTRKSRSREEEELDESEGSSDDAIRSPRRGQRLQRRLNSSSVTEIHESDHSEIWNERNEKQNNVSRRELTRAIRPPRMKTTRQKQLELLRRRRAGEHVASESDEELEFEAPTEDQHADPDSLDEIDEDYLLMRNGGNPNLDEYEEDFIEDGDDTLGAPLGLEDIPLEFTHHAHKKPIEHFKDVVEWMVHNKLNPAFARNDQIYIIARYKLDDAVQGFAGSKFISSAWKADFAKALKKFPDIEATPIGTMFDRSCEACGRSGHPAKHQLVFKGKPYHRESLEDISSDEDSGGEDDDESQDTHTPQSKAFFLGRTCNANAEMAHALHHWRHHLNQFVLNLLRAEGHTSPEKILEREGWSVKKKEKYANRVVDGMEQDGRMRELYKEFKENLEAARDAKNEVYSYGR